MLKKRNFIPVALQIFKRHSSISDLPDIYKNNFHPLQWKHWILQLYSIIPHSIEHFLFLSAETSTELFWLQTNYIQIGYTCALYTQYFTSPILMTSSNTPPNFKNLKYQNSRSVKSALWLSTVFIHYFLAVRAEGKTIVTHC